MTAGSFGSSVQLTQKFFSMFCSGVPSRRPAPRKASRRILRRGRPKGLEAPRFTSGPLVGAWAACFARRGGRLFQRPSTAAFVEMMSQVSSAREALLGTFVAAMDEMEASTKAAEKRAMEAAPEASGSLARSWRRLDVSGDLPTTFAAARRFLNCRNNAHEREPIQETSDGENHSIQRRESDSVFWRRIISERSKSARPTSRACHVWLRPRSTPEGANGHKRP
jgi:hypothetical protein